MEIVAKVSIKQVILVLFFTFFEIIVIFFEIIVIFFDDKSSSYVTYL